MMTAAALGVAIGLVLALTGAGGGILAIPLLVFGLHLPIQHAAPVGLAAVGLSAAVGAGLGLREGIVRYRAAALIGTAGMLAAPAGVALAHRLPGRPLLAVFAAVLGFVAWRMLRPEPPATVATGRAQSKEPPSPAPPCLVDTTDGRLAWTPRCARALGGTGAASGLLSGLLGVGGGFVIVPALTRYTDLDVRSIQATSLAVIALVSASGVAAAALHGALRWDVLLPFAGGAIGAMLAGRQLARRLAAVRLKQAFGATSAVVAVLMLARAAGWTAP